MAIEASYGLSLAYMAMGADKKWREVAQGGNHYLGAAYQTKGLFALSSVISRIAETIPNSSLRIMATITNTLVPAAGLIVCPLSAAVKQRHYENGVVVLDNFCPSITAHLPKKLDETRVKLFTFISDNTNKLTTIGIMAGAVALPFLGFGTFAAGLAIPVAFQALESSNLLPSSVSLTVEKYMPSVVNASLLLSGGIFSQALGAVCLAGSSPQISDFFQKKLEGVVLKRLQNQGATLEEIDAPWLEKDNLSYEEIVYILENKNESIYNINPAHCSKQACENLAIPEDGDFNKFWALFDNINWSTRYPLLKRAFKDDDRFQEFIKDSFPLLTDEEIVEGFESHIEKLALPLGLSKEDYLAKQLKSQMEIFISLLKKEHAPQGFQHDLEDAIKSSSQILAYLNNLPADDKNSEIEIEDILMKLAVEGGNYCPRGVKRCTNEITSGIYAKMTSQADDPAKSYEWKIRQLLQLQRKQIMENLCLQTVGLMVQLSKEGMSTRFSTEKQTTDKHAVSLTEDIHVMDLYRQYYALGFYPLTENERSLYTLQDIIQWSMNGAIRNQMYLFYQTGLDQAFKEAGEVNFPLYLRQKITSLPQLTPEQKEELIDKLTLCENGEETLKGFRRLFFVMQGILNVDLTYTETDWVQVEKSDVDADWAML